MGGKYVAVAQGDSAESIAASSGLLLDKIWGHPNNQALSQLRKDPHVLLPGDQLFVPDPEPKDITGAANQVHSFVRKGTSSKLHLVLLGDDKSPVVDQPYVLTVDGQDFRGNTGSSGIIQQSIPPGAMSGKLIVGTGKHQRIYSLRLGGLDPVTEVSGAQGRLKNLGYMIPAIDGQLGPETKEALSQFQQANGLDATGDLNDETQAKLKEAHGC
ncbi:MAG: peptidoglycan-binding domain-containing protein [Bryobacteraceae bacterium]